MSTSCPPSGPVSPAASPAYDWMVRYLLPFSLMLLMVTVDLRAIARLGGKALVMIDLCLAQGCATTRDDPAHVQVL